VVPEIKLYEPIVGITPSTVKEDDIVTNQLDASYYSPSANAFTMRAHFLAYEPLPKIKSPRLKAQIETTVMDLEAAMRSNESIGYCNQFRLKEEGVTALCKNLAMIS
jgi:hypothetical protein